MRTGFWLGILIGLLTGCGRVLTPTPVVEGVATPTLTATPQQVAPTATLRPTATPRRATPIATPTPTVTPTPVIYEVQAGDTILDIALNFNITVEDIQEANGIVDPRFLQIGQPLIIPPPRTGPGDPPTATPTPLPLVVEEVNFQRTRQGTLWCLGRVQNPGPTALTEVVLEASLFDGEGALLAREAAFTALDVVEAGEAVPFAILFRSPPSSFAQYYVLPVSGVPYSSESRYYLDLEAFDLSGQPEGLSTYRIQGELRNFGEADAESIRLVAVAYNEAGTVLAQRQAELAVNILRAGATTPFEIDLLIPQGTVASYEVLVQGLRSE